MQCATIGEKITPLDAYNRLIRYKRYWGETGGVTVSGGEPLTNIPFLIELGKLLKKDNISLTIDTSAATFSLNEAYLEKFDELLKYCDLFLLDLKSLDDDLHKKITGKSNKNVLEAFSYLAKKKFPIWVRYVLLPSYTDNEDLLNRSGEFLKSLGNVMRLEVLPYHTLAIPKYEALHREYYLKDIYPPSEEQIKKANQIIDSAYFNKYLQK